MMTSDGFKPQAPQLIRRCQPADFEAMYAIINDAAQAYRGVIPPDRWREPYMPREELAHEIRQGVAFWGLEQAGVLLGVMGLQPVIGMVRGSWCFVPFSPPVIVRRFRSKSASDQRSDVTAANRQPR